MQVNPAGNLAIKIFGCVSETVMNDKKRIFLLVAILAVACIAVTGSTITVLYRTALQDNDMKALAEAKEEALLAVAKWTKLFEMFPDFTGIEHDLVLANKLLIDIARMQDIGK